MEVTKSIKFDYTQTNKLRELIEGTYFNDTNNGKLPELTTKSLVVEKGEVLYQVLDGLDYDVKLRNNDIIEGSIRCKVTSVEDMITLSPISRYCIKVNVGMDEKEKYCFY